MSDTDPGEDDDDDDAVGVVLVGVVGADKVAEEKTSWTVTRDNTLFC